MGVSSVVIAEIIAVLVHSLAQLITISKMDAEDVKKDLDNEIAKAKLRDPEDLPDPLLPGQGGSQ